MQNNNNLSVEEFEIDIYISIIHELCLRFKTRKSLFYLKLEYFVLKIQAANFFCCVEILKTVRAQASFWMCRFKATLFWLRHSQRFKTFL